jgi:hypothetical protein
MAMLRSQKIQTEYISPELYLRENTNDASNPANEQGSLRKQTNPSKFRNAEFVDSSMFGLIRCPLRSPLIFSVTKMAIISTLAAFSRAYPLQEIFLIFALIYAETKI